MRLIIFVLIALVISGFACKVTPPAYETMTFTVEAGYMQEIELTTTAKGIIEGYFTITGGERDIYFFINDPYGYAVFGPYVSTDFDDFRVRTIYVGTYTLAFDNGLSFYDRYITLHYRGYKN